MGGLGTLPRRGVGSPIVIRLLEAAELRAGSQRGEVELALPRVYLDPDRASVTEWGYTYCSAADLLALEQDIREALNGIRRRTESAARKRRTAFGEQVEYARAVAAAHELDLPLLYRVLHGLKNL
ncbi:hypothetical protein AF335_28975 [Streptomyces eurocidicus]|uniref:Uncharacterized protein n=1 Tax=Streptomyces eurocidicus TaxID=66423 RepID=A0A2N8NNG8_STREU|nr:hypothetical protein AF335_28975 [Streptomyces eurocidicus]